MVAWRGALTECFSSRTIKAGSTAAFYVNPMLNMLVDFMTVSVKYESTSHDLLSKQFSPPVTCMHFELDYIL